MSVSALLWVVMVTLASTGHWLTALFILLFLLSIYGLLGSTSGGKTDLRLLAFPSLAWLALWAIAFALGNHYAVAFAGRSPEFTVLGCPPSFAAIVVFFWIVPTLLMGFGFEAIKDRWLSRQQWDEFVRRIDELSREVDDDGEQP